MNASSVCSFASSTARSYLGNQRAGDESQIIRIGTAQSQTFLTGIGNAIVTGRTWELTPIRAS